MYVVEKTTQIGKKDNTKTTEQPIYKYKSSNDRLDLYGDADTRNKPCYCLNDFYILIMRY